MMTREVLRTSLNLEDEHELKLFQHAAKNKNISAYLKRLIFLDMVGKGEAVNEPVEDIQRVEDDGLSTFT